MPRESVTGLKRIDGDLYQEDWKEGEPREWIRAVPRLDILLLEIQMIGGGSYDRDSEDAREWTLPSRRIAAVGTLEGRSIYVTDPDGAEPARRFDEVSVTLHRAGDDFEKDCQKKAQRDLNVEILPKSRLLRCGGIHYSSKRSKFEALPMPEIEMLIPSSILPGSN